MHRTTIDYRDYNDVPRTMKLAFHLDERAAYEDVTIADDFVAVRALFEGESRELDNDEKQTLVNFASKIIKLSYGEVSPDGIRFRQGDEVLAKFKETPAYTKFFMGLFAPDPSKLFEFILQIVPQSIVQRAEAENPELAAQYHEAKAELAASKETTKAEVTPVELNTDNPELRYGSLTFPTVEERDDFIAWKESKNNS